MTRSMEDEFKSVSGMSGPLWCFLVAFMLFNVEGSDLYFWIALIPIMLILIIGTKLSHVIATLMLESGDLSSGAKLKPRDELFWFQNPEILLSLIHFIPFQNAFELTSFSGSGFRMMYWSVLAPHTVSSRHHIAHISEATKSLVKEFVLSVDVRHG